MLTPASSPTTTGVPIEEELARLGKECLPKREPAVYTRPPTYFSPYRHIITNDFHEGQVQALQFKSYPLRDVTEIFDELWANEPTIIDTTKVLNYQPEAESFFEGIPFRVTAHLRDAWTLCQSTELFPLHQASTFVFRKQDVDHTRYFVEYCQWIQDHKAYLKVSGLTAKGEKVPPTDPSFPSFIFIVPACLIGWIPIEPTIQGIITREPWSSIYVDSDGKEVPCMICSNSASSSSSSKTILN